MSTPPAGQVPATISRRSRGPTIPARVAWLLVAALVLVIAISIGTHHESRRERLVTRIVTAVQNNDMRPVEDDFDAQARKSMTHEKVGHLADLLAPMGKIKSVTETTPKGAGATRTYVVHFENGDWEVSMPLDVDGKAEGFYMRRMSGG